MTHELVSVVIPSYNHATYVCEAVESALAQTGCQIEVVVVDDGSTDNTREALTRFGGRIVYVHQENQGLSAARNTGIRHATGEWISLLDADDLWHPQKTERQLLAVRNNPTAIVVGSPGCDDMPEELPTKFTTRWLSLPDFLADTTITASSTMIRRSAFDEVGLFDTTLRSAEDRDMWLRLVTRFPVLEADLPCWHYRIHEGQMSHNPDRMYVNFRKALDKFFSDHPEHRAFKPQAYGFLYHDAAICYAEANRKIPAMAFGLRSSLRHPCDIGRGPWSRLKLMTRLAFGRKTVGVLKRLSQKLPSVQSVPASTAENQPV